VTAARIPDERALRDPGGACVADERQTLDNAAFAGKVTALAALFDVAGLRPGGVLAIVLPNRVELITSMFAAWRLGAAVTPVNPALTAQEARYQIDDAGATLVVADEAATTRLRDGPYRFLGLDEVNAPAVPETPALVTEPGALALLIYTSGTTGRPKGVMLDHANISATAELIIGWFEMTADTRSLLVLPLPGVDVGVVDEADQLLPAGQAGEVVVRGPNVMRGYLRRPEETARVLRGGRLHTGDVGRFDEDGYLTLVDRVKDLIIRGGENIYPKEIEDILYAHPAVLEAAVVGQPDQVFGEQPVAFVALRSGFDVVPGDLIEHCRQSLARYKVPREVYIEDVLPKNAVGKIAKPALRTRLQHT
jgi:acyl-CoA synthetase (AMP-forming)/AMP-acid ligase II